MKSFKGLASILKSKNEKIKSAIKKRPSSVTILNTILYTSAASGFYWSPYLND